MNEFQKIFLNKLVELSIAEDIGDGDHTSMACITENTSGSAKLLVKQDGIIAGVEVACFVFEAIDRNLIVELFIQDGTEVKIGDVVFHVEGNVHSLLKAERLVLNIMQRMSGIATETKKYVDKISDLKTNLLDTRKTTPGMRVLEKMAFQIGGGVNHRMGLYDMMMIKDNHVDFAGGIENAMLAAQKYLSDTGRNLKIELEVRNFEELNQAISIGGMDRIMLDNFTPENTAKAVDLIAGKFETEASGGINLETLRDYALAGVDFISVGAVTHQIKSLDLSLKAIFKI